MNLLKNVKMKVKLITSFLVLALLIVVVGVYSILSLIRVSNASKQMYEVDLQSVYMLTDISRNLHKIKSDMLELIYVKGDTTKVTLKNDIEKLVTLDNTHMEAYSKIATLPEEAQLWNEFKSQLEQYRTLRNKAVELIDKGNYSEAEIKNQQATMIMNQSIEKLDTIVKDNIEDAKQSNTSNIETHRKINIIMTTIMFLGFIIAISLGVLISYDITAPLLKIKAYAERLALYDFSLPIIISRSDELGQTGLALNAAQKNVRELVASIKSDSQQLSAASEELSASAEELSVSSQDIERAVMNISIDVQEASASSEEITASIQEVDASIIQLSQKALEGSINANHSKGRAIDVKQKSKLAIGETRQLHQEKKEMSLKVMEQGKASNDIKIMADTIANIANQTNLLALNAAIEAARAGEQGKGFAVVAEEIKKLAEQSSHSVVSIQDTISKVEEAFKASQDNSNDILKFINENVNQQLDNFELTGDQYFEDSDFVSRMSDEINCMSNGLTTTIAEVSKAAESLSELSQNCSVNSDTIKSSVSETTKVIEQVAITAENQAAIAQKLNEIIQRFII